MAKSTKPPSGDSAVQRRCDHTYEARFDEYSAGNISKKVYVRDVCIRCGATVDR